MRQPRLAPFILLALVLALAGGTARLASAQAPPPNSTAADPVTPATPVMPVGIDPKLCAVPAALSPAASAPDKKAMRRARVQLDVAHEAYIKGDFASSLAALQEAYALEPGVDILYNMAQSCRAVGLLAQALPLYEAVLKLDPTPDQQQACNAKISELRPKVAETENTQAVQALAEKRYEQAIAGFDKAVSLDPQPAYLFRLGEAQRQGGKTADAIATYQRILTEAPNSINASAARQQLGVFKAQQADEEATAHYDKGEYVQAVLGWDAAYRESPRPLYLFRKAEAMRQTGQRKEAAAEYQRFLAAGTPTEELDLREQATRWIKELGLPVKGRKPLYTRWWFWTSLIGGIAVATGVAVGVGVAASNRPTGLFTDIPVQNVRPVNP